VTSVIDWIDVARGFLPHRCRTSRGRALAHFTYHRILEEVARTDASAAWLIAIANESASGIGYMPEAAAEEIFGPDPDIIIASGQPFLTQILVGVKHRVQIDAKGRRHFPGRRKPIARVQSAGGGIRSHRRSQLLEQRRIAHRVDAEQHSPILSSVIVRIWQMPSHGSHSPVSCRG
jgi:hypothetical protein